MVLCMTLTYRSRSNLTSLMDSSDRGSYWCSIHFICLTCLDKMLQAAVSVFNVFPMGAFWPWFDLLEVIVTYLSLYICGSLGATQYPQETDSKSHYCTFVPLFNIAILKFLLSPVTLRMMSRSKGWYETKVMVGLINWHIQKDVVVKTH